MSKKKCESRIERDKEDAYGSEIVEDLLKHMRILDGASASTNRVKQLLYLKHLMPTIEGKMLEIVSNRSERMKGWKVKVK